MICKWIWYASGYFGKVKHVSADKNNNTNHRFVEVMTWSFRALTMGRWIEKDWEGNPFPKGSRADMNEGELLADGPLSKSN